MTPQIMTIQLEIHGMCIKQYSEIYDELDEKDGKGNNYQRHHTYWKPWKSIEPRSKALLS